MSDLKFRKAHDHIKAVLEFDQSELDYLLYVLTPRSELHARIAEAATLVRKMEAPL